jgi:serine/threonine protein kinase
MALPARATPAQAEGEDCSTGHGLEPGRVFAGKYKLVQRIAEGGMGVVWHATHLGLGADVALKLIRSDHLAQEAFVTRLLQEARLVASLHSEHVNRVLDVSRTDQGTPYLVLEYLEGQDLLRHLQDHGPIEPQRAVDYLIQTCEALAEAHGVGIVHRDLKPENLFLSLEADGSTVLKVLDFGISQRLAPEQNNSSPLSLEGTPSYMAPEQITRAQEVDSRSDIWALGIILHELCTGRTPFEHESVSGVFEKVLAEDPPPLELERVEAPEGLGSVVKKCLMRDPQQRYQDVVELARALAPFGVDSSAAERVAKVASTTRERVTAAAAARSPRPQSDAPAPSTESTGPGSSDSSARAKVRLKPWLAGALAGSSVLAAAGVCFAIAWSSSKSSSRLDTAAPVLSARPEAEAPSKAALAQRAAEPSSSGQQASELTGSASSAEPNSLAPALTSRPPAAQLGQTPRLKRTPPSAVRRGAARPVSKSPIADAWDPNSFGGRR